MTPAERQAVLETKLDHLIKAVDTLTDEIEALKAEVREDKADLAQDKADLAQMKSHGRGILIGVSLAASAMGAAFSNKLGAILTAIVGVFK